MVGSGGGVLLSSRKVGAVRAAAAVEQGEHVGSTAERPGTVSAHPDAPAQRGGPPSGDGDLQPAHPRWRRALRWVLALLAIAAISIATGIGTASAEGNLGPHRAQYDVTWDDRISVDLGPLGALVVDSPLPLSLGAHVVVLEIPWAQGGSAQPLTGQVLAADLDQYVQFFSAPQATIEVAARALAADAARRAAATGLTLTVIAVGGSRLLGRRRRRLRRGRLRRLPGFRTGCRLGRSSRGGGSRGGCCGSRGSLARLDLGGGGTVGRLERHVVGDVRLHAHELVERDAVQVGERDEVARVGRRLGALPLRHGLARQPQPRGQLLLAEALLAPHLG